MGLWEKISFVIICVWGWIFVYKLNGAKLVKQVIGIKELDEEQSKFKRFVTSNRFFKIVLWFIVVIMAIMIFLDSV